MIVDEKDYLAHYGILRRSGRYPWGSGKTQSTRNKTFLDMVADLRKQGMTDPEICQGFGIVNEQTGKPSTTQLRAAVTIARNQQKQEQIGMAQRLKDKGLSNGAIAERMQLPGESSVRALLAPGAKDKADVLISTANMLKREVEEKRFVDIGAGVETHLGISKEKLNAAVSILREEGYTVHRPKEKQIGTGLDTEFKVLAPPGTKWHEVQNNRDQIQQITGFSTDGGRKYARIHEPLAVSPSRVKVRYKEDGGGEADGVIYVRRGVEDISLGKSNYAQVRVKVGNDHYLKGMAMYKDDLPKGVDLVFNTNKSDTGNHLDAMKKIKDNPEELPFGAVVRQIIADHDTPNERVTSAMNIVNEEGNWAGWSKNLSSQFLSKQNPSLAKSQLNMTFERRQQEFNDIMALTNPTIKKKLLEGFADSTDSAAVHLESAALNSRQRWHAILPIDTMPPTQIYAPNYKDGERVVLIRYPHAGTFEIPELTVNNKHPEAKRLLGNEAPDVVGIHHSVAQRLSGADFDGDTVIVIPNNRGQVKTSPALEQLKNFDPMTYKLPDDSPIPRLTSKRKGQLMGDVSNLITDMTIKGASHEEISRAVKHSMVVIDAEKHNLDWRRSAADNGITQLKKDYQGRATAGAATLISRAGSPKHVDERKPRPAALGGPINKETGQREFIPTGRTKLDVKGNTVPRQFRSTKLAETDDAHTLSSGTPMEKIYADHSNTLKALANKARLAQINTPPLKYSPSANKAYASEVETLNAKLTLARMNAPRERQAQLIANALVRAKRDANPNLDSDSIKKIKFKELELARQRMGAGKQLIEISPKEWDAIQAGAISNHKLDQILDNANLEVVSKLATPRVKEVMTAAKADRARRMLDDGYTRADVANQIGVSLSTLDNTFNGSEA